MADTRISLLPAITGALAATDDVLCLVDTSAAANKKIALSEVGEAIGLGNVDNTSDANKPISTATQAALDVKQPLDADLTAIAGLTSAADTVPYFTGSGTAALKTLGAASGNIPLVGTSSATDALAGLVELVTSAEHKTGTDSVRALTSAAARAENIVAGTAIATTSGTAHDFTGIPSWVKRITVMFSGVSTNGTSIPMVQIGDAGGFEVTGYLGTASNMATGVTATSMSSGFLLEALHAAAYLLHGSIVFTKLDSNVWVATGVTGNSETAVIHPIAGSKTLTGTLTQIRLTTVGGTDTFDAGSINIIYE